MKKNSIRFLVLLNLLLLPFGIAAQEASAPAKAATQEESAVSASPSTPANNQKVIETPTPLSQDAPAEAAAETELKAQDTNVASYGNMTFMIPENITNEEAFGVMDKFADKLALAEKGDSHYAHLIGMMYIQAILFERNIPKGLKLFNIAVQNGDPQALFNLIAFYNAGAYVEHNEKKAMDIIKVIDSKKDPALWFRLNQHLESGNLNMKDQEMANNFLMKAVEAGYPDAMKKVAYMLRTGEGLEKNAEGAIAIYQKMYEKGNEKIKKEAALLISGMYTAGTEVPKDGDKALEWIKKLAVEINDVTSQLRVGYAYRDGTGVAKDYKEAMKWFQKAEANGSAEGQVNIGYFYANGMGVAQDYAKAKEYYYNSALAGNSTAAWYLTNMYADGKGVEKNTEEALKWQRLYQSLINKKPDLVADPSAKESATPTTLKK